MTALWPPKNLWLSFIWGFKRRKRLAASTSASTMILFWASTARVPVMVVLPVPPFPLITVSCFINETPLFLTIIVEISAGRGGGLRPTICLGSRQWRSGDQKE